MSFFSLPFFYLYESAVISVVVVAVAVIAEVIVVAVICSVRKETIIIYAE